MGTAQHMTSASRKTHTMFDLTNTQHHPVIDDLVQVLCNKTQNVDGGFFRTEIAYFLGKMAATMRATIVTKDRGDIPVNIYALALATSGFGKGHSVNIIENEFMTGFRKRFMDDTFPVIAEQHLWNIANKRAAKNQTDPNEEFERVEKEFKAAGALPFTFDSGTPPAVKQLRHKLLMSNIGAINLQIDEIGSNLIANTDVLTLFLELFDQGLVKQKLTKNTAESQRGEELDGKTPTNMLLFGTPAKLLDGGLTEDQFYAFLETGYARRCLFGWGQHKRSTEALSASEIYDRLTKAQNQTSAQKWSDRFDQLADPAMFGWKMTVDDNVGIKLIEYKLHCEAIADALADHEEIKKAELSHRYFKALKLAGAFAFIDRSAEVEMEHLMSSIKLVEESGTSFQTILNREKTYMKLAKYIADVENEVTHADLMEALPFYKSGNAARNEIMTLATAWGYKQHIIIKKRFIDGIEFFEGETLKAVDTDKIEISYSDNWAFDYQSEQVKFDDLHKLTQATDMHFCNHAFKNGHRADENIVPGFNMIVIDVDGGCSLSTAHDLLSEIKFMTYTTKRHEEDGDHRFRILIPMNYRLELDQTEYKEFMNAFLEWLPFKTDEAANQRSKKWSTFDGGTHHYNDGELCDILPFIPKTSRNEMLKSENQKLENLDNLERWFAQRIATGSRNNEMVKYALALVDGGMTLLEVNTQVLAFNAKLSNPLPEDEIGATIMVTVAKRYQRK